MNSQSEAIDQDESAADPEVAAADASDATAETAAETGSEEPSAEPTLESVTAERDEIYQHLQRVTADFENFQKRVKRDRLKWPRTDCQGFGRLRQPRATSITTASSSDNTTTADSVRAVLTRLLANRTQSTAD